MVYDIHGRICVKRGNRFFAVPKPATRTDRAATRSASGVGRNYWPDRVEMQSGGGRRAHVIANQRH